MRALLVGGTGAVFCAGVMLLALGTGSVPISPTEVFDALFDTRFVSAANGPGANGEHSQIVLQLRLPRVLAAAGCGAALALAGALLQVLLRNPLADPYILGMSGGAAVGALSVALLFSAVLAPWGALAGALLSSALVFVLGARALRSPAIATSSANATGVTLILIGVIVAAASGALVSLLLVFMPDQSMRGMLIWLMGDFNGVQSYLWVWLALLLAVPCVLYLAPGLNLMATGELRAQALGVPVVRRRIQVIALAGVLTAASVQTAGTIGFVGLVIPHLLRLLLGNDQRVLLPACMLFGATFLLLTDTLARTAIAPIQLPVGAVTALIGVPLFLYLLLRNGTRP